MRSDFEEILFSVVIPAIWIVLVAALVMGAPSVDQILKSW